MCLCKKWKQQIKQRKRIQIYILNTKNQGKREEDTNNRVGMMLFTQNGEIIEFLIFKSSIRLIEIYSKFDNIIQTILYMEKTFALILFVSIATIANCDIQTGVIDINRQMGNLDEINSYENALAYTHLFVRSFPVTPQIATSLIQFGTDSQYSFQMKIKTRKIQTDKTKFKLIIIARNALSIWQRVVLFYFVTERSDFAVNTITLQTTDLAGLTNVPQQLFEIKLDKKFKKPIVAAFINGFDIQTRRSIEGQLIFQVSIQVTQILQDRFTVSVTRVSHTQIYEISIGYIAADPIETEGYSLQLLKNSQNVPEIVHESPYLLQIAHELNLDHAKLMYGFEQFRFNYKQAKEQQRVPKNLAILIQQSEIIIGSFDSKYLEQISFVYFVIKQSVKCKSDQITVKDPLTRQLSCKKCQTQNNRVPNKNGDECVCLEGHYQIKEKCYKLPDSSKWDEQHKIFVCDDLYTMIRNDKLDTYVCQKTPKNQLYDSTANKWSCLNSFYMVNNDCISIPKHGLINKSTNQLECQDPYHLISGSCIGAEDNEEYSISQKKYVCVEGSYRINNFCLKPYPHSHYSEEQKNFVCNDQYYPKAEGACQKIPQLMIYDRKQKKLACQTDLYEIKDEGCKRKPEFMVYDQAQKIFVCDSEYHLSQNRCRRAEENEEWNEKIKQFVCKEGAYRIKQKCKLPRPNTRYSEIASDFVCIQGFYLIKQQCLTPPPKMKYHEAEKRFTCKKQYHQLEKENSIQCLEIPQNMKWENEMQKFVCVDNFYEIQDGKCHQPKLNQKYNEKTKQFICLENFVKIEESCKPLPKNSIFDSLSNSFTCIQGFYKYDKQSCHQCRQDCFECADANNCKSCRKGFELSQIQQGKQRHCLQICGDGTKFNQQCDDGNKINGDGCSSECKKEQGWKCAGGSPQTADKCEKNQIKAQPCKLIQIKMDGMTHLYGKVVINVRASNIDKELLNNNPTLSNSVFRILTNSKIPVKTSVMHLDYSENKFVIIFDFNKVEPIPVFITRVQLSPEFKQSHYPDCEAKPLMLRIDPVYMALRDKQQTL